MCVCVSERVGGGGDGRREGYKRVSVSACIRVLWENLKYVSK